MGLMFGKFADEYIVRVVDVYAIPLGMTLCCERSWVKVSMETKGKGVSIDGVPLPFEEGEIDFGESDSNDQHRFYQLIHQGRVIPCDFIGVVKSQQPVYLKGATLTTVPLRVNVLSKGLSYKEL
ncbi:hypothetical protein C5167_017133 [Papaver somniferum]|uniref:Glucose-6-phosphate isomerase n=1 Tax=Papaver somniferum TaxID=3469 RepID=A0A4Y7IIJ1_PAPSO|nr:hypothetical protein C5167_017133 [Papaver somniferum]